MDGIFEVPHYFCALKEDNKKISVNSLISNSKLVEIHINCYIIMLIDNAK